MFVFLFYNKVPGKCIFGQLKNVTHFLIYLKKKWNVIFEILEMN